MSETLTVIRSLDSVPLRKGIAYDSATGLVSIVKKFTGCDRFKSELNEIDGIDSAYAVLSGIAGDKFSAVVMGRPVDGVDLNEMKRNSQTIQEQPRQLVAFDVDSFSYDTELFDKFKDVRDLAEIVRAFFPAPFQNAKCIFNITNSHGTEPDNLRLRLYFWLDTPVTELGLKSWWNSAKGLPVDQSVWQPAQLIFTALPSVAGGDPVKDRWGILDGVEAVCVPVHRLAGNTAAVLAKPSNLFQYYAEENHPLAVFQATEELRSRLMLAVAAGDVQPNVAGMRTPWFLNNVKRLRDYYVIGDDAVEIVLKLCHEAGINDATTLKSLEESVPRWLETGQNPLGYSRQQGRQGHFEAVVDADEISPEAVAEGLAAKKSKARGNLKHYSFNDFAESAYTIPRVDLIKGYFRQAKLVVMYGSSNAGKSFVALDMAGAIASGQDFNGKKTTKSGVVYFAAEGSDGLRARHAAMVISRGLPSTTKIDFLTGALNLSSSGEELAYFKKEIARIEGISGKTGLVIIDTYSQINSGDENSSQESNVISKMLSTIVDELNVTVMILHHSGKDLSRGARGSNVLRGHIDTELEVEGGILKVTKQRDMAYVEPTSYLIKGYVLPRPDSKGEAIDGGVIEWLDSTTTQIKALKEPRKDSLGWFALEAYAAVVADTGRESVPVELLRTATRERHGLKFTSPPGASSIWRAVDKLIESGHFERSEIAGVAGVRKPIRLAGGSDFTIADDD